MYVSRFQVTAADMDQSSTLDDSLGVLPLTDLDCKISDMAMPVSSNELGREAKRRKIEKTDEILTEALATLKQVQVTDQYDAFGSYVASLMRKWATRDEDISEDFRDSVSNLLNEGNRKFREMGKRARNSPVDNCFVDNE